MRMHGVVLAFVAALLAVGGEAQVLSGRRGENAYAGAIGVSCDVVLRSALNRLDNNTNPTDIAVFEAWEEYWDCRRGKIVFKDEGSWFGDLVSELGDALDEFMSDVGDLLIRNQRSICALDSAATGLAVGIISTVVEGPSAGAGAAVMTADSTAELCNSNDPEEEDKDESKDEDKDEHEGT